MMNSSENKKRLHFGVVISALNDFCEFEIWKGITENAYEHDIHLTAYIGSYQMSHFEFDFTMHFATCFKALSESSVDGVIIFASSISQRISDKTIEEYLGWLPPHVPVVSISHVMPGIPTLLADNIGGMYDATNHLIKQHGKKNIVFIKGPEGHSEGEWRFDGYKRALAENGLTLDGKYVFPGQFSKKSGHDAVTEMLDIRNIKADAIVAANDATAFGAMDELKSRGIKVPDEIAVIGFDGDRLGEIYMPSLSTVCQDFNSMGREGVETLISILSGNPVDPIRFVPTEMILRQSCGCPASRFSVEENKFKERQMLEHGFSEVRAELRGMISKLVLFLDIDKLAFELHKSLLPYSMGTVLIGVYESFVKDGKHSTDKSLSKFVGYDGTSKLSTECKSVKGITLSNYSQIPGFDIERELRTFFFIPLVFGDEELGVAIIPYDPSMPPDLYETLRLNLASAIKGEELHTTKENALSASRAKSSFLSRVSHELRTPLNVINGMAKLGQKDTQLKDCLERFDKIVMSSNHLSNIINDVLEMSRIESGKTEIRSGVLSLRKVVNECVELLAFQANDKAISLTSAIDTDLPDMLIGDEFRVRQVLINLLSNAVKYTVEGSVSLVISKEEHNGSKYTIVFNVSDTGIGMSEEFLTKVFMPFEQEDSYLSRRYEGSGLGLSISHNLVKLMGGDMTVVSKLGEGSTFSFTVPFEIAADDQMPEVSTAEEIDSDSLRGKRILIADDYDINRMIVNEVLASADPGIEQYHACDGKEAYDKFVQSPEWFFDCILMDVQMPNMDGYTASMEIRKSDRADCMIPIIAISANALKEDIDNALAAGMNDHLAKPLDFDECVAKIKLWCTKKSHNESIEKAKD